MQSPEKTPNPNPSHNPTHNPPSDPIYHQCWQSLQPDPTQKYLSQSQTIEWFNRVLAQKNLLQEMADIDVREKLEEFEREVHGLEKKNGVGEIGFGFREVVQFYLWVVGRQAEGGEGGDDGEDGGDGEGGDGEDGENQEQQQNIDAAEQQQQSQERKNHQTKPHQGNNNQESQQPYLYPSNNHHQPQPPQNEFSPDLPLNHPNPTQPQPQPQLSKNYTEYLHTIFQHYCRMSYATGNDPTFEQIQQKTQVMTINKFMIFCKDFGIMKLHDMNRQNLVEIFKKNSEFYREMSYQRFLGVLVKISFMVYSPGYEGEPTQNSKQFQQLLLFLQVNNSTAFKKKIQSLNISYRARPTTNAPQQKKLLPSNYKFKYNASGGKSEQEVRQEIEERKRIRSENKIGNKGKILGKMGRNGSSRKELGKVGDEGKEGKEGKEGREVGKGDEVRKKIGPPLPPVRKVSNTKPTQQEQAPVVTGYANIHKLKLMGKQDSKMKLNSIVQQAKRILKLNTNPNQPPEHSSNRIQTYGRQTPYSHHTDYPYPINSDRDLTNSQQSNYSQSQSQSQRDLHLLDENPVYQNQNQSYNYSRRAYVAHGHSQLEKRVVGKDTHEDLKGIINNQSDQDQFLEEHLNREKKTGQVNQRIQKKIRQYQLKNIQN